MTVASATALYSAVGAGMLTLTGVVFSLVFVMVQFSSAAYSPRLVTFVARDPLLFHATGVFTATFLYALAALAWVDRNGSGNVPSLSAYIVMALLIASMAVFVGLVHRLARLHIHNVLRFTGDFGREVIDKLYPPLGATGAVEALEEFRRSSAQTLVYTGPPKAIQSFDVEALLALADSELFVTCPIHGGAQFFQRDIFGLAQRDYLLFPGHDFRGGRRDFRRYLGGDGLDPMDVAVQ